MKKLLRTTAVGILALLLGNNGLGSNAIAEEAAAAAAPVDDVVVNQADTLEELLRNVEERRVTESREHSRREQRFARDKDQQARMLADLDQLSRDDGCLLGWFHHHRVSSRDCG